MVESGVVAQLELRDGVGQVGPACGADELLDDAGLARPSHHDQRAGVADAGRVVLAAGRVVHQLHGLLEDGVVVQQDHRALVQESVVQRPERLRTVGGELTEILLDPLGMSGQRRGEVADPHAGSLERRRGFRPEAAVDEHQPHAAQVRDRRRQLQLSVRRRRAEPGRG